MTRAARAGIGLLLAVVLGLAQLTPARPAPPGGTGYLFLSPNTQEQLAPAEAFARMRSPEQGEFRRLVGSILVQAGVRGSRTSDALGDWSDGENSLLVELPLHADPDTVRYAAVWSGLLARQKMVLVFLPHPAGEDEVAVLEVPERDLGRLREALDRHDLPFRTLVPRGPGHRVVIFDDGAQWAARIDRLGGQYGVRALRTRGTGAWVGESTREGARVRYHDEIRRYEREGVRPHFRPGPPPLVRSRTP